MSEALETAKQARNNLEQARRVLLSLNPEVLDSSNALLGEALRRMSLLEGSLAAGLPEARPELLAEVREFGRDLARVQALAVNAAAFYLGWGRLLHAALNGYTAQGQAAAPPPARRFVVRG